MAVIPRPASTVVLMDHLYRVYLTKRPKSMKFLGGYYVFPGGAVEESDYKFDFRFIKELNKEETIDFVHYIAAARELFEEVGILVCCSDDGSPIQLREKTKTDYRRQLMNGEISFLQMLKEEELFLDIENLKYFGHIITPETSPIRFDTRFFLAKLPEGQSPKPDLSEIDEAIWLSPKEALASHQNGNISFVRPTIHTLKTIINYQNGSPLMMPEMKRN
nr:NUDIX hydrolase [Neobacillus sp. Marseille-Q6967]